MSAENEYKRYHFPQMLGQQTRIFGMYLDEAILLIVPSVLGLVFGYYFLGMISGGLLMFILKKLKRGRSSTYLYNSIYWYFPSYARGAIFKKAPPSYLRHWIK